MKVPSRRFIESCPVTSVSRVGGEIFLLSCRSANIAQTVLPGQFVNIRVSDAYVPLLRRPFSVYRTASRSLEIIFNTVGPGTTILSRKKEDERIDILGPLGTGYGVDGGFETALLVAGGLGVAPFPLLTEFLLRSGKQVYTFLGARTRDQLVPAYLENASVATDDGSEGFRGTVVDLLEHRMRLRDFNRPKIFGCGPNRMLQALSSLALGRDILCEVSMECAMACGFGICQGCPVERVGSVGGGSGHGTRYSLVCKEGPVFNARTIRIE